MKKKYRKFDDLAFEKVEVGSEYYFDLIAHGLLGVKGRLVKQKKTDSWLFTRLKKR